MPKELCFDLTQPVLTKTGEIIESHYQTIDDDQIPAGDVLVSVAELTYLAQISGKKALLLTVEDSPEDLTLPLSQLDAIFIEFTAFTDGRGYSYATLLRRQGFNGELRAVGDVFKDVLNYLKRSGFDSFVLKHRQDLAAAAQGLQDFRQVYQASTAVGQANYQTGQSE